MFVRYSIVVILLLFSACRASDRIHCPEVKTQKMKRSTARQGASRHTPGTLSAFVKPQRTYTRENDRMDRIPVKNPQDMEEWDCPRPGEQSNHKIVKENKKRMEKKMRMALKKRERIDPATSVIPQPQQAEK